MRSTTKRQGFNQSFGNANREFGCARLGKRLADRFFAGTFDASIPSWADPSAAIEEYRYDRSWEGMTVEAWATFIGSCGFKLPRSAYVTSQLMLHYDVR